MTGSPEEYDRKRCHDIQASRDLSGLPYLVERLELGERGVQDAAFDALASLGGPSVAKVVLPLLRSLDERVRNLAREILAPLGKRAIPEILPYLQDQDPNVQIFAVELLGAWKEAGLLTSLEPLAHSPHPNVRSQVAITLGTAGLSSGASILAKLCRDEDEWVCFAAVEALERMGDPASRMVLGDCLVGSDPLLSRAALDALLAQGGEEAAALVAEALDFLAKDSSTLARAIRGLLDFSESNPSWRPTAKKKVEEALEASLKGGSSWEKARAVRLAGLLGLEGLRGQAEVLATGTAGPERIEAVEALGKWSGGPSKALLSTLLKDPDADIVEKARQALDRGKKA